MQPDAGHRLCNVCNSHVETPAFFCDMCGVPFPGAPAVTPGSVNQPITLEPPRAVAVYVESTPSTGGVVPNTFAPTAISPGANWSWIAIRFGIPIAVAILAIALMASKNRNAGTILWLLLPAMIGTAVGAANLEEVNRALEGVNNWTVGKLAAHKGGDGKRHRFILRPWHWLLTRINTGAGSIENPSVRNGVTVGAYFYLLGFFAFLAYVAVAIVVGIILIGITFWIISIFADGHGSSSSSSAPSRLAGKKHPLQGRFVKEGLFGNTPTGQQIDADGRLVKEGLFGNSPTGIKYEDDGRGGHRIVKEGFFGNSPTGAKIDSDGRIMDEGLFGDSPTGKKIDSDGRIVKEGLFGDSPTGVKLDRDR